MALLELVFGSPQLAQIGIVRLDASVEERHIKTNEITSHPIEEGANISDHIRRQPNEITIQGVITDTPVYIAADLLAPNPLDGQATTSERVGKALDELERIMNDGDLVDVLTTLKSYTNMALESMDVLRNARNGNSLSVTLSLREIVIATADELVVPEPEDPSNRAVQNNGKKPTKPANDPRTNAAEESSVIYDLLGLEKFPKQAPVF